MEPAEPQQERQAFAVRRDEHDRCADAPRGSVAPDPLDTRAIFEKLIENEVRSGRLSPWRRRRIIKYAAQLRLSAIEAGKMIDECRRRMEADRATDPRPAFKIIRQEDDNADAATVWKIWLIVVAAIIFDLLMIKWLT